MLHNVQSKFAGFRIGMSLAHHADAHFIETCIAQRNSGISAIKQFINGFAFLQTSQSAVLPKDRCYIGNGSEKTFVSAA